MNAEYQPTSAALEAEASALLDQAVRRHFQMLTTSRVYSAVDRQWHDLANAEHQERHQQATQQLRQQEHTLRERIAETEQALLTQLQRNANQVAPGLMSVPWSDQAWKTLPVNSGPRPASHIRIGTLPSRFRDGNRNAPALLPLLDHAGWIVGCPQPEFIALVHSVLLRLFATLPLQRTAVTLFDPHLELPIGAFAAIRDASPETLPATITRTTELQDALEAIFRHTVHATDELSAVGVSNLAEHWQNVGRLDLTYRLVIVNAYPQGLGEPAMRLLQQLAAMSGSRGVTMIVRRDSGDARDASGALQLPRLLRPLQISSAVASAADIPALAITPDPAPPRPLIEDTLACITRSSSSALPTVDLREIIDAIPDLWTDAEPDGLRAPFGRTGRSTMRLRLLSADPPLPNVLIGGATGQGKSNLLLAIIHALAARYQPDQLRMYLLDFRQGVELSSLGPTRDDPTWLPHADVLGLESDREYGLSVLDHLIAQFRIRSDLLTRSGFKSIVDYHRAGHTDLPRLVLMVDEFQMLIDGDDEIAHRAVARLEQLARQGRGYGIHIILASQTTSGIRGLATKGEAIFGQFPTRMSLKNTTAESQAILGAGNRAAAELAYRGEIVANENFGQPDNNRRGIVARADEGYLRELRDRLWRQDKGQHDPPEVFRGSAPHPWSKTTALRMLSHANSVTAGIYRAWIAQPVAVAPRPIDVQLARDSDQSVVLVGSHEETAAGVLGAVMFSLAATPRPQRWVVLDGTHDESKTEDAGPATWLDTVRQMAERGGHMFEYVHRTAVASWLTGNGPSLLACERERDTFVFLLAPQRVANFADSVIQNDVFVSPQDVVRDVMASGAQRGVFVIGWWPNTRTVQQHLGFQPAGIGAHVLFGLGRDELSGLIDPREPLPQSQPRVIVKDPRSHPEIRVGVPFEPPQDALLAQFERSR